jgi:carbon monoxide dehydrogenase subunit G
MEKLLNEFLVHRPIDETWAVLTDVERIAPCMPGATLQEIEGDVYRGVVKVKLGAISTAFKGEARFVERDDAQHRAVLHGEGRDTTGKGNADAMITATLESVSASTTKCVVQTDLRVTGKVAQFGRGIMADVSKKLMAQFATNLNTMLDQSGDATPAPVEQVASPAQAGGAQGTAAPATETETQTPASATTPEPPKVRKIDGPANEPIELSGLAGGAVLKRALPVVGVVLLLLLVVRQLRRR